MSERQVVLYFSWSRPDETEAPLTVINNRFPALFESRRMLYPRYEAFSRTDVFDQGIGGFLDHIQLPNFTAFAEYAGNITQHPVPMVERMGDDGLAQEINDELLRDVDTLVVISLDSLRSRQAPTSNEMQAIRRFLAHPDHLLFVCPHHDIGDVNGLPENRQAARQEQEFYHHGDKTIPPQQRFGGFARSLLAELDMPVENQFGLHPRLDASGEPWPFHADRALDRWHLLRDVGAFNAHPHLPHLARIGPALSRFDVLVRQEISPDAPPHPFQLAGTPMFDALLQSAPGVFQGTLLVSDATLWSSTAGGTEQLQRFWTNVLQRALPV
ncbi:hypothetical protein [Dyella sp. C11]|uniref:hypothetical protein n=1 Tax=Dyella sp. C11 TaxID=2126991 RepID=UPI000D64A77A|nr:hypothetical protein [Dyella sp. C11]